MESGRIDECQQPRFTHIDMRIFDEQMKVTRSTFNWQY